MDGNILQRTEEATEAESDTVLLLLTSEGSEAQGYAPSKTPEVPPLSVSFHFTFFQNVSGLLLLPSIPPSFGNGTFSPFFGT